MGRRVIYYIILPLYPDHPFIFVQPPPPLNTPNTLNTLKYSSLSIQRPQSHEHKPHRPNPHNDRENRSEATKTTKNSQKPLIIMKTTIQIHSPQAKNSQTNPHLEQPSQVHTSQSQQTNQPKPRTANTFADEQPGRGRQIRSLSERSKAGTIRPTDTDHY